MHARLAPGEMLGDRILKLNHAGENGAINIYRGQICAAHITSRSSLEELKECLRHEQRHRETFARAIGERSLSRCGSYHICGIGGFLLGLLTGLMGRSAIAATTVAVESVVLRHLEVQRDTLRAIDPDAVAAIDSIVADEREHHAHFVHCMPVNSIFIKVLTPVVAVSTEMVIWLGMHL